MSASPGRSPVDMAVQAGRAAISASAVSSTDVRWTLHAGSGYQGPMGWPIHHGIQHGIVGNVGNALEVKQYCAAGLTTWIMASSMLSGDDGAVVCTGADNWSWGDRYATSRAAGGEPFSDVAHAVVLTGGDGFADILGYGTASCPGQARVWQTRESFWENASLDDYRAAYERAVAAHRPEDARDSLRMLVRAVRSALSAAALSPQYITHFIPHGTGSGEPYRTLADKIGLPWSEALYDYQVAQGYLAVSTQVAGLIHCAETGLKADSIVLLVAAEYQLSATAVVLRIRRTPQVSGDGDVRVMA
ncbi:hypothetical protein [Mycolicibacterium mageritense]|uniref:hypothetical protein n=1 Tax=Mycolicibacterium mageritense TaxID=53462 RepID=UPI001E5034E1|nr:hypothetical protein [Mycolicibacterium mageritense]